MEIYYNKLPAEDQIKAKEFLKTTIMLLESIKTESIQLNNTSSITPNDNDFNRIMKEMESKYTDDDKIKFVLLTFKHSLITSEQLGRILEKCTFDDAKEKIIVSLKNNIIDRYNSYYIINTIDSLIIKG